MKTKAKNLFTSLILVMMLVVNTTFVNATAVTKLNVYYLNVGQADCALIENKGHFALIDAGNNVDETTVINFLKSKGVKRLDLIIATHPHEDHIGAMDAVVKNFSFDKIIMPKVTTTTKTFTDLVNAIKDKKKSATIVKVGSKYKIGNADLTILAPNTTKYGDLNNYSVVTRLTYGKNSFLFMGDAETISENEILSKKLNVKADVLKVGHHGSEYSTSQAFLNAVNPKYAVISVGEKNIYGHPNSITLSKLNAKSIKTYRTDLNGTVTASSNGSQIAFSVQKTSSGIATTVPKPGTVYFTPSGKSYHYNKKCSTLSRSKTILSGTIKAAIKSGHADPCDRCVK
jgi:competence protein ComEC